LLKGILSPPITVSERLLPETNSILQKIVACSVLRQHQGNSTITEDKFTSLYKMLDERTSSLPSGRHLGHYKVAAESLDLSALYTSMMQIPHLAGFSPRHWRGIVDVMLEKKQGDSRVHHLHIVAFQESDFNQSNRLVIGRSLLWDMEDTTSVPEMQCGSRSAKLCLSAVLNKVVTYKILRYNKSTTAFVENDAVGCYDRITNSLVFLFLQ
jgi:hypothetical protein